jgi:hypothetical protein
MFILNTCAVIARVSLVRAAQPGVPARSLVLTPVPPRPQRAAPDFTQKSLVASSRPASAVILTSQKEICRAASENLPDPVRMAGGLDGAEIDSSKSASTARGLNQRLSDVHPGNHAAPHSDRRRMTPSHVACSRSFSESKDTKSSPPTASINCPFWNATPRPGSRYRTG